MSKLEEKIKDSDIYVKAVKSLEKNKLHKRLLYLQVNGFDEFVNFKIAFPKGGNIHIEDDKVYMCISTRWYYEVEFNFVFIGYIDEF